MAKIFKYHIPLNLAIGQYGTFNIISQGLVLDILSAGLDANNKPCIWMVVDPEREGKAMTFSIIGTGHDAPTKTTSIYLDTITVGQFVWHIFFENFL